MNGHSDVSFKSILRVRFNIKARTRLAQPSHGHQVDQPVDRRPKAMRVECIVHAESAC